MEEKRRAHESAGVCRGARRMFYAGAVRKTVGGFFKKQVFATWRLVETKTKKVRKNPVRGSSPGSQFGGQN